MSTTHIQSNNGFNGEGEIATSGEELLSPQARDITPSRHGLRRTPQGNSRDLSGAPSLAIEDDQKSMIEEERSPPLPPRPANLNLPDEPIKRPPSPFQRQNQALRPHLQSQATTALSLTDIHTHSLPDGSRETFANLSKATPSGRSSKIQSPIGQLRGYDDSEGGDSTSIRSYAPTLEAGGDIESLLGEVLGAGQQSPAWNLLSSQTEVVDPFDLLTYGDDHVAADFTHEFDDIGELSLDGKNEGSQFLV